ncbi:hypothetical protein [Terrisporobacter vanillatitrophus]|uniref:hypothetical protein n=1 Tax=Terrisporobacter vanillatitrophus TaxID=3058402 RepID=UPI0033687DEC
MKKLVTLALSLLFVFGAVACNNRNNITTENAGTTGDATDTIDQAYYNTYTGLYDKNLGKITSEDMFSSNVDSAERIYRGAEYPGNRQYLTDVKKAYKDRKEKMQAFIDGLKKDTKTEDAELKKMNESLIAEGEKLIQDIDAKIEKLDKITGDDYNKSEDDFIKLVDNIVNADDTVTNKFSDMLKNMDKRLGIDRTK